MKQKYLWFYQLQQKEIKLHSDCPTKFLIRCRLFLLPSVCPWHEKKGIISCVLLDHKLLDHVSWKKKPLRNLTIFDSFGKWSFFNCYLASPWPTLGHCRGGSLANLMLITAFESGFDPKETGGLVNNTCFLLEKLMIQKKQMEHLKESICKKDI